MQQRGGCIILLGDAARDFTRLPHSERGDERLVNSET